VLGRRRSPADEIECDGVADRRLTAVGKLHLIVDAGKTGLKCEFVDIARPDLRNRHLSRLEAALCIHLRSPAFTHYGIAIFAPFAPPLLDGSEVDRSESLDPPTGVCTSASGPATPADHV